MSILSVEREVNGSQLETYLPRAGSNLPALIDKAESGDNFTERDILYKVLFDMKADMADLKKLVFKMLDGSENEREILEEHKDLFASPEALPSTIEEDSPEVETPTLVISNEENFDGEIEDITHETEFEDSLLL